MGKFIGLSWIQLKQRRDEHTTIIWTNFKASAINGINDAFLIQRY